MPITRERNENKVAHALATHSRLATHQWRHTVRLKHLFTEEASHETVDRLCQNAAVQLRSVAQAESARGDQKNENERDYFIQQLESIADGFDGLIGAVEGESIEDREREFDYQPGELYDLGDAKIELSDGRLQKFLWVA